MLRRFWVKPLNRRHSTQQSFADVLQTNLLALYNGTVLTAPNLLGSLTNSLASNWGLDAEAVSAVPEPPTHVLLGLGCRPCSQRPFVKRSCHRHGWFAPGNIDPLQ